MTPVVLLLFLAPLLSCCRAEDKPVDCSDIFKQNPSSSSGVYSIYPFSEQFSVQAYCDRETDGGGWTVFQRRMDGTVNFYRGWDQYVAGFGDADREYWLGLDFIHKITAKRPQELLVKMEDFEGNKASARYSSFSVGGECDGYKLTVSGFTDGGAGDSLRPHNNMKFSTFDNDQDTWPDNCAQSFLGAFWYSNCHDSNPNSVYLWGVHPPLYAIGVIWQTWKGDDYSLKSIRFQTRPLNCCSNQTFS
uniref:Microfibril associated protein 4 n=1 Tax=Neogobius melanostomus TaxID=47308 RepID=A0A8C6U066_9GOBI